MQLNPAQLAPQKSAQPCSQTGTAQWGLTFSGEKFPGGRKVGELNMEWEIKIVCLVGGKERRKEEKGRSYGAFRKEREEIGGEKNQMPLKSLWVPTHDSLYHIGILHLHLPACKF